MQILFKLKFGNPKAPQGRPQGPPKGAQGGSKHGTRWNPQRKPHSLVGRLYALATVYNTEPAGTHWNPQRNPHSLVGRLYTFATVYNLESAENCGGARTVWWVRSARLLQFYIM